jgi:hypothetical protein
MAKFTRLLETPLQRRQALKIMAGTAGALTLAACGVAPGETPTPEPKTKLLVLRARVKNLQGRDRLRAIANFLNPANRSHVDILGEYWAEDGLIVNGKPGGEFINGGIHIVVLAKGESAAAVRAWADQWADVLDIDSDEAAAIDLDSLDPNDGDQHFLVFERIEGATTPKAVFGAEPDDVDIASHHTLVNDGGRQMMIVRAPSRGAVYEWVNDWGYHQAIEVLRLSNLSEKLRICARSSPTAADTATLATALAAAPLAVAPPQKTIEVADYHPDGLLLTTDQKLGSFYFRHRATGRFLSIDGALRVVSVATPAPADKWTFSRGQFLDRRLVTSFITRCNTKAPVSSLPATEREASARVVILTAATWEP